MAIISGFFNSVNGDRKYDASFFAEYFASFIGNGIFPNPSTNLQVVESTNMNIVVKPGKGWINGYILKNTDDYILNLDNADGVLNRIDRIVVRYKHDDRNNIITVKKGTFASNPVAPSLQRDADVYELALADVYVGKGVTTITQANITDQRMKNDLCGIVHGVVDQVDTTSIFNQYQSWFNLFSEDQKNNFEEWFASLKGTLGEDSAGNLYNLIADHKVDYIAHPAIGTTTNSGNAYAVSVNPAPITYTDKMGLMVTINSSTVGAATINVNEIGPVPIKKSDGEDVARLTKDTIVTMRYSSVAQAFILQGESGVNKSQQINSLSSTVGSLISGQIKLDWVNPTDTKLKGVRIMYKIGSYPTSPTDGSVFYDSNDAIPVNTLTKTGFIDGATYYFRAFAWTYENATRVYTSDTIGAQCTAIPYQTKGKITFTSSQNWQVPYGVTSVDVFLVGGGGGGGSAYMTTIGGSGGGGGYTKTQKNIAVTPGGYIPIIVGSGGSGGSGGSSSNNGSSGGASSFNSSLTANGGSGGSYNTVGGSGGSGGGGGGNNTSNAGAGGSDGSNGVYGSLGNGTGQGTTTKEFGETTGTLYSGGGGGGTGAGSSPGAGGTGGGGSGGNKITGYASTGTNNTGGGGGGGGSIGSSNSLASGGKGGSGIVIVRWGY